MKRKGHNLSAIQCVHLFLYIPVDFCCAYSADPFHTVLTESWHLLSFIHSLGKHLSNELLITTRQFLGHKGRHLTSLACKFIIWCPTEIGKGCYNKINTVLCDRSEHRILWEQKTIFHLEFAK